MTEATQENKEKKYDRQLRLWGLDGQTLLESAHIGVLHGGAVGSETLKNLVLPGIGHFTIIDKAKVSNRDLGNNFFVEIGSLGKSRAVEVSRLLYELNDFVKSSNSVEEDPVELINSNPDFVSKYTHVVATELPDASVLKLEHSCRKHNIPLIVVRCNGLLGYLRISAGQHVVIESKPAFPPEDLRLSDPFLELEAFVDSVDYSKLNSIEYVHVPFPVILVKSLKAWKASHNGKLPSGDAEKNEFKKSIESLKHKSEQENIEEALKKAHFCYNPYSIPTEIQNILDNPNAKNLTKSSDKFWILAAAVNSYVKNEGNGKLPLMGTIPDMTSDTKTFVALQHLYRNKSLADAAIVKHHVENILGKLELPKNYIDEEYITLYCKHVLFLKALNYTTIGDEQHAEKIDSAAVTAHLTNWLTGSPGDGCWYFALRSSEKFLAEKGRYPGEKVDHVVAQDDFDSLRKYADEIAQAFGITSEEIPNENLQELIRYGNSQIHNTAAIMGGITAQEIIKLITHKWVPLENTLIFNGINSSSIQVKL